MTEPEFSPAVLRAMLQLALAEIDRLSGQLDGAYKRGDLWRDECHTARDRRDAAESAAKAYKGELDLIAEQLGAESIATIRDEIRVLQDRIRKEQQP